MPVAQRNAAREVPLKLPVFGARVAGLSTGAKELRLDPGSVAQLVRAHP
jgi:hypothetical protein